jgi:tRNA A-37 threonylcarbamoyl transferase component Bud32
MRTLLQDIDHHIEHPWKVLKDDPTSTVVLVKIDEQYLVIKRANTKNGLHKIRRLVAVSRARKNWRNALRLAKIGIPTFSPIALMEERFGPLKKRCYFICSYIQGVDALHYFACGAKPQSNWHGVAIKIANMLQVLAAHSLSHRDLNLSNIIVIDNQQPCLIDLDGMRRHWLTFFAKRGAVRERNRFMENWDETPGVLPETVRLFQSIFSEIKKSKSE